MRVRGGPILNATIKHFLEWKEEQDIPRFAAYLEKAATRIAAQFQKLAKHFLGGLNGLQISPFHVRKLYAHGIGGKIVSLIETEEKARHGSPFRGAEICREQKLIAMTNVRFL